MHIDKSLKYVKEHKILISLLVFIISSHYYYLYFITFHEGVTHTPLVMQIVKIFASVLFYLTFFDFRRAKCSIDMLSISVSLAIVILVYKSVYFSVNDFLFLNFFALSIPYVFFRPRLHTEVVNIFFPTLILILCMQIIIDYILVQHSKSIWENKAFIGGFGNPSTFGIICNLATAYIITRRHKNYHLIPLFIVTYGACQTKSLATIAVLLSLYLLNILHQKNKFDVAFSIAIAFFATGIILYNLEGHLAYKLESLIRYLNIQQYSPISERELTTPTNSISTSIGNRSLLYHQIIVNFTDNPLKMLLLGSVTSFYNSADSQFVTFSNSFGILLSCIILCSLIFPFFTGILYNSKYFSQACGLIFITYCGSNRILEYYPISFIFIFLLGQIYYNQHRIQLQSTTSHAIH